MNREEHGLGSADVAEAVCLGSSGESDGRLVLRRAFLLRRAYGGQGVSGSEGNGRKECRNIRGVRPRLHRARLIRVPPCSSVVAHPRSESGARCDLRSCGSSRHPKWPPQIWQVARMRGKGLMPGVDGQRDSGIRRSFPAGRPAPPGRRRRIPVGEPRRLAGGNAPHAKEAGVNGSLQERLEREVTAGQRRAGKG